MADSLFIRVKQKGGSWKDDLHEFTDKWQEVSLERVRGNYLDDPALEVVEDKKHAKETAVQPEVVEEASGGSGE